MVAYSIISIGSNVNRHLPTTKGSINTNSVLVRITLKVQPAATFISRAVLAVCAFLLAIISHTKSIHTRGVIIIYIRFIGAHMLNLAVIVVLVYAFNLHTALRLPTIGVVDAVRIGCLLHYALSHIATDHIVIFLVEAFLVGEIYHKIVVFAWQANLPRSRGYDVASFISGTIFSRHARSAPAKRP